MEKRKKTSPIKEFTQRLPEPQEQEERFDINKCLFEIEFGRKRLIPLKDEIVRDYNCQTTLELMLAGRISTLYWRIARWEKWLNSLFEHGDDVYCYFNQNENVSAVRELGKGIESAHRQMITSIALLKELKHPPLNLKIKTQGAFIAQNQQINVEKRKEKNEKRKIIEAQ